MEEKMELEEEGNKYVEIRISLVRTRIVRKYTSGSQPNFLKIHFWTVTLVSGCAFPESIISLWKSKYDDL